VETNTLYYGDNLEILRKRVANDSIDLIYLDPPFNSKADYNILFKELSGEASRAQIQAFSDFWHWDVEARHAYEFLTTQSSNYNLSRLIQSLYGFLGKNDMLAYLVMMAIRLQELHRVLKSSGSLFIHCDPTASHYLKILLDAIFDPRNFRNEIIWRRTGAHGAKRSFAPIHDTLLFYTKTSDYYFKEVKKPYMKGHVDTRYTKDDSGEYKFTSGGNILTGAGATKGESGKVWRGFDPTAKNRHWAVPQYLTEQMPPEFGRLSVLEKLEYLYKEGFIEIKEGSAWPTPVRYLRPDDGQPLPDIWAAQPYTEGTVFETNDIIDADVAWLGTTDPERLGYQTQKPLGLLERIIKSACPDNGIVLDPFCGCGTAIIAAEKLRRKWIGIDITYLAINLVKNRLKDAFPQATFNVEGEPRDLGAAIELAKDRYQFQWWALSLVGARPLGATATDPTRGKKGADKGIDGWLRFSDGPEGNVETIIVQVKSGKVGVKDIREFRDVIQNRKAAIGLFITLEAPTRDMIDEAKQTEPYISPRWKHEFPKIQILTIEGLLEGIRPNIPTTINPYKEASIEKRFDNTHQSTLT
jgi:site-specific DNA-methyltransferase (adenine-specific)